MTNLIEKLAILILHKITKNPKKNIEWELGWFKSNDARLDIDSTIFVDDDALLPGGYSLINFMTGYLDWHAKLSQGWAPHEFH